MLRNVVLSALIFSFLNTSGAARGQGRSAQAPPVVSPEVHADRRVTFRIAAPDAQKVELRSPGDIPGSIAAGGLSPFP